MWELFCHFIYLRVYILTVVGTQMTLPISKKRILFTSLLVAIGMLAASCGSSSDNTVPQITEPGTNIADSDNPETSAIPSGTTDPESPTSDSTVPNSTTTSSSRQRVPDLPTATAVAAGFDHTCALLEDKTMSCWGSDYAGQLGRAGFISWSNVPERVQNVSEVTAIVAGAAYSCALHVDGTISCWGRNYNRQLGNADCIEDSYGHFVEWCNEETRQLGNRNFYGPGLPVQVSDIVDATAISAGNFHVCALHANGTVSCWGSNTRGQIGNGEKGDEWAGDSADVARPARVPGIDNAIAVSAGRIHHTCVLHYDNTVSCWGNNRSGELGNGEKAADWADDSADSVVPVKVKNINDAVSIGTGAGYSCVLHRNKTVSCWGNNGSGQLGNGQVGGRTSSAVPQQVEGVTDAISLSVGLATACVIHESGNVSCWGLNWSGQLGNGIHSNDVQDDSVNSGVPVPIKNLSDAIEVSIGYSHACALLKVGTISCWGDNEGGQIGNGRNYYGRTTAVRVEAVNVSDVDAVVAGENHTCALHEGGTVSCWGSNSSGQLGSGTVGAELDTPTPTPIADIAGAVAIATTKNHTCALMEDGTITCWGDNSSGQLGNGRSGSNRDAESENTATPVTVIDIDEATAITTGWDHTCALMKDSTISCWGNNSFGQLGDGTNRSTSVPVRDADITDAIAITAGWDHTCALKRDGSIYCWGDNLDGQLGNGTTSGSSVPTRVADITDATAISANRNHTCALLQNGNIYCWGSNSHGQLGSQRTDLTGSPTPLQVADITDATAVSAGGSHTCAIHEDDTASCWGNNDDGQLGNDKTNRSSSPLQISPVQVTDLSDAIAITAGGSHTCTLRQTSTITCWGNNENEQLGDSHLPRTPEKVKAIGGA